MYIFPVLCNLSLVYVRINDEAMTSLVANCLNLEDLNFDTCTGIERLEIFGLSKLKKARVQYLYQEPLAIEIEALSPDFTYVCENLYENEGFCDIELYGCSNLKRFLAIGTALDDMDLHSLLGNFPLLEQLHLHHCDCLRYMQISAPKLVYLVLVQCQWLQKAELNAPNLKKFHYEDDDPIPVSIEGSYTKVEGGQYLPKPDIKNDKYYAVLVQFFAKLRHCEDVILCVGSEEDLKVPEKVRMKTRLPLSGVKHLMVKLRVSFKKHTPASFLEGLLWLAPSIETISISNSCVPVLKTLEVSQ